MLLFAPALQNPDQPMVEDAAVWLRGDTIHYAGPREKLPAGAESDKDRREIRGCVLFPGLVNAHSHLELTALEGLKNPGDFVSWIRNILSAKHTLSNQEQKRSLSKGVWQCLLGGTTAVGDHISVEGDIEDLLNAPFRGKIFIEILGVVPQVARDILDCAKSTASVLSPSSSLLEMIPSPHSVHALDPEILQETLEAKGSVFSIHLAESEVEAEYFQKNSGTLFEFIAERGRTLIRSEKTGVLELENRGLLNDRILVVHGNYLEADEVKLISEKQISIVHCPLSHQYFSHRPFPLGPVLEARINVALGTDSLASAKSLSMLEVLRQTKKNFPELTQEQIFYMGTRGGAKALKLDEEIGDIREGKKADLVGIRLKPGSTPLQSIFQAEQVDFSMINGKMLVG